MRTAENPEPGIITGRFWVFYWRGMPVLYVRRRPWR